jgi:hypothetical protein
MERTEWTDPTMTTVMSVDAAQSEPINDGGDGDDKSSQA